MLAFLDMIGGGEMLLLLVIGLLLFGRDLPQVGRKVGRTVAQLKRGMQEFKDQIDREASIQELKQTVHETIHDVRRAAVVPRMLADPAGAVRELATEAMRMPTDAAPAASGEAGAPAAATSADAVAPTPAPEIQGEHLGSAQDGPRGDPPAASQHP